MTKTVFSFLLALTLLWGFPSCAPDAAPGGADPDPVTPVNPEGDPSDPDFVEEDDDKSPDVVRNLDYSRLAACGHPRILLDEEGFRDLKSKVTTGRFTWKTLYKLHSLVIAQADAVLLENKELTSSSAHEEVVRHLFSLSYAAKLTGKATYLAKAVHDLDVVCRWTNWNPSSFLSTGEICFAVAVAYDWLYYDLSLELRKKAHSAMVFKGINPSLNSSFRSFWGNWNQVCNNGVMCAAMAIYEKDKAVSVNVIEKGLADNKKAVEAIYKPDGAYLEGIGYWDYGTTSEAILLQTMERIFGGTNGIADIPGFRSSGRYAVYMHGTMNTTFSYSDGGSTTDTRCLASWWYAAMHRDPSLAFAEKHLLDNGSYASAYSRLLPAVPCFLSGYNLDQDGVSAPSGELFTARGEMPVAIVRRGWDYSSSDIYVGIKGGHCDSWKTCSTAHAHMDAGSFVFEADGVRWSDDIMRPSYGAWFEALKAAGSSSGDTSQKGLRWDTFRVNNLCHSTLVAYSNDGSVSGKLHPNDYYVNGIATIAEVFDTPQKRGVTLDLSAPMKGQVKSAMRTVVLEGEDLVITDEVEALPGIDAPLEWRLLTLASAEVSSGSVKLTGNNKAERYVRVVADSGLAPVFKSWPTSKPSSWSSARDLDQKISGRQLVGWSCTVPSGKKAVFVTTLSRK